jgi:hypothetical protein
MRELPPKSPAFVEGAERRAQPAKGIFATSIGYPRPHPSKPRPKLPAPSQPGRANTQTRIRDPQATDRVSQRILKLKN